MQCFPPRPRQFNNSLLIKSLDTGLPFESVFFFSFFLFCLTLSFHGTVRGGFLSDELTKLQSCTTALLYSPRTKLAGRICIFYLTERRRKRKKKQFWNDEDSEDFPRRNLRKNTLIIPTNSVPVMIGCLVVCCESCLHVYLIRGRGSSVVKPSAS